MKKNLLFSSLIILAGCSPMRSPEYCLPENFCEKDQIENPAMDECSLAQWWDNFKDPVLTQLIATALTYNQDLNIAREKICESRSIAGVNYSILLPQINGEAAATRIRNSLTLSDSLFLGGKFMNVYEIGFDANWEVDLFGKNYDAYLGSMYDSDAAVANAYDLHLSLASEVGRTYVVIRSLQEQMALIQEYITALDEVARLAHVRFSGGLDPKQPYLDAVALSDRKKAELNQASEEYKQALYQLGLLEGRTPEEIGCCFTSQGLIPEATTLVPQIFPSELLCRRFDVRSAEFSLLATRARVSSARKELFPTINLTGFYTFTTGYLSRIFQERSKFWEVTPGLSIPLFHGGGILSNISAVTSRQRQAAYAYEKAVYVALTDVESSLVAVSQEKMRVETFRNAVKANREKTQLERVRYLGGLINLQTYLIAEELLFDYRMNEIQAKENLMVSLISLYKAMGGGWECPEQQCCE